jgi:hypothetical protein
VRVAAERNWTLANEKRKAMSTKARAKERSTYFYPGMTATICLRQEDVGDEITVRAEGVRSCHLDFGCGPVIRNKLSPE